MLKLVGTEDDGTIADEKILLDENNNPTPIVIAIALAEVACSIVLACILAKTVFRKLS